MKTNTYHDLVDRNDIAKSVEFRNSDGPHRKMFPPHAFEGKTVDEAITWWEAQAVKTDELEAILKLFEENSDLLASDEDFVLIRELLAHPERDRLRLISDGSYYTHRIWIHIDADDEVVRVSPTICWKDSEFKRMSKRMEELSPREKIDFLFKNFEVVYVQTPAYTSREDIEDAIRWEKIDREADYVGWEDVD